MYLPRIYIFLGDLWVFWGENTVKKDLTTIGGWVIKILTKDISG
jgi:hypothetical protein